MTETCGLTAIAAKLHWFVERLLSEPPSLSRMQSKSVSSPIYKLTEILLLVLMMWPAPIPVGHRHSDYASPVTAEHLDEHLRCFHGGFSNSANWPDDWHWHWVYPVDRCANLDADDVHSRPQPWVSGRALEAPLLCVSQLDRVALTQIIARPTIPFERQQSFLSVMLLRSGLSLPELLGVVRC